VYDVRDAPFLRRVECRIEEAAIILKPAVERGAEAQLIQPSGLTQKPQLTHRVSLDFCASPSS